MLISRYERMIARRYLLPGRGEAFIAIVAGFSLLAVMLGVAALVVVMSVLNGFRGELFDKITGLNGHAVIQGYNGQLRNWQEIADAAKKTPGVTSATPLIEQPLFTTFNGRADAVMLRGMRVEDIASNPMLQGKEVLGKLSSLQPGSEQIAIGSRLAQSLGASLGSSISIVNPLGSSTPFGTVPRIVQYRVAAIFEVGIWDYDKALAVLPLEDAQTLLLMGDSVGIVEIETNDPDNVDQILKPLEPQILRQGQMVTWRTMNAELFEAISLDRVVTSTVVSIIILVASFNIVSTLIMLVWAKKRDIAVLRTMGATRAGLMRIFVTVGLTIGSLGIVAGLLLSALFIQFRASVVQFIGLVSGQEVWNPEMRFLTELPARTDPLEVIGIVAMAFIFCFLATLYPAWKAASTDPVQVLRYE